MIFLVWKSSINSLKSGALNKKVVADPGSVERGDARGFGGFPPIFLWSILANLGDFLKVSGENGGGEDAPPPYFRQKLDPPLEGLMLTI